MFVEPNEATAKPSRDTRKRVRVERGIYKRVTAEGKTRYEVLHYDGDGKQRVEIVEGNVNDARRRRGELISKPQGERPVQARVTFAVLAEEWLAARSTSGRRPLRPRTAAYYRSTLDNVLLPRFGRWQVAAIDPNAIAKLTRDLEREGLHAIDPERPKRPLGASSISNYLKPLQGVLALAVRRRIVGVNPFDVLTADDRPAERVRAVAHAWSPEEIGGLLKASRALAAGKAARFDYEPVLWLAATLGLRCGEVLGLTWADFNREEGTLTVRRQWLRTGQYGPTKTRAAERTVPLPDGVRDRLIALRLASRFSQDEHPVFASRSGLPLGHRNVTRRGFEPARDAAGLPERLTFHDLRHACASRLIGGGLDPVAVAATLGHEDASTTLKVYAHVFDARRTAAAVREALAGGL